MILSRVGRLQPLASRWKRFALEGKFYSSSTTEEPVKYSTSKASTWKAEYSRKGAPRKVEAAWFQPYAVCSSVTAFLLYFCWLREENDYDQILNKSLYERIDGLEESQLKTSLAFNKEMGKTTRDIQIRLEEIQKAKVTE